MTSAFFIFSKNADISKFYGEKGKFLPCYKDDNEYYHAAKFYLQCSVLRLDIAILKFADISKNDICPNKCIKQLNIGSDRKKV